MTIAILIVVVNSHQAAGKSEHFTVGDEYGLVDFSGGIDVQTAEEKYQSGDSEYGCRDELYVGVVFHFECKSSIKKRSHQKSDFAR